jgi:hypothetical protein
MMLHTDVTVDYRDVDHYRARVVFLGGGSLVQHGYDVML